MQNSNLSSTIFPIIKDSWAIFIKRVEKEYKSILSNLDKDKTRIKNLARHTRKLEEALAKCKDNIEEILNYREIFVYIDKSLESSFDALNYFKEQDNFDNSAVRSIFEKIITSPEIIKVNSEYRRLSMQVQLATDRIKNLAELISGSKINYNLIKELLDKYQFDDNTKKNILFYPVVMLSIKQNEVRKESSEQKLEAKKKFYRERFNELTNKYHEKKEQINELLVRCYKATGNMSPGELSMYTSYINKPEEAIELNFSDEKMFKLYSLSFFKLKADIEKYRDGIKELLNELDNDSAKDLDFEISYFSELINEFYGLIDKLNSFSIPEREEEIELDTDDFSISNVFFALDPFNRVIIDELLTEKNMSNLRALLQKINDVTNSRIEGVKTNPVQGVKFAEDLINEKISMITTSKLKLAYIVVNKKVLILCGTDGNERIEGLVNALAKDASFTIRKQIELLKKENIDFDYLERQQKVIDRIMGETTKHY